MLVLVVLSDINFDDGKLHCAYIFISTLIMIHVYSVKIIYNYWNLFSPFTQREMGKPKNPNNSDMQVSLNQNLFIFITDTGAFSCVFLSNQGGKSACIGGIYFLNKIIKYLKIVNMQCALLVFVLPLNYFCHGALYLHRFCCVCNIKTKY